MKLLVKAGYWKIPVVKSGVIHELRIYHKQEQILEFRVPVEESVSGEYQADFYAVLPMKQYLGCELSVELNAPSAFWDAIEQSDVWEEAEKERPGIHFTPVSGWMNDPNGLYWQNGEYHLYFQYNPFHVVWDNMSWGHAVSTDLLHWKQLDSVMFPDEDGMIFSGCAVMNERELAGFPKDTPLFFYTATGGRTKWAEKKKVTQKMACSSDGGKTLVKVSEPVLDFIVDENRDPKIYWHEERQHYYMVLYLTGNEFAIFVSEDLKNWEMTQRFSAGKCNECPDLRQISCEDGEKKWVFSTADGFYSVCSFDGNCITEFGEIQEAYMTKIPYAAQTFVGLSEDRVISMAWLRADNHGDIFTGYQSLPRELYLRKKGDDHYLIQKPVREYFLQREEVSNGTEVDQSLALTAEIGGSVSIDLGGISCSYEPDTGICRIGKQELFFEGRPQKISVLLDGKIAEVSDSEYLRTGILVLDEQRTTENVSIISGEQENARFYINR